MSWFFDYTGDAKAIGQKVRENKDVPDGIKVLAADTLAAMDAALKGMPAEIRRSYRARSTGHLDTFNGGNASVEVSRVEFLQDPQVVPQPAQEGTGGSPPAGT